MFLDDRSRKSKINGWASSNNANDNIYIGSRNDGNHTLDGAVARVLIFDKALSAHDVNALYEMSMNKKAEKEFSNHHN